MSRTTQDRVRGSLIRSGRRNTANFICTNDYAIAEYPVSVTQDFDRATLNAVELTQF